MAADNFAIGTRDAIQSRFNQISLLGLLILLLLVRHLF